MFHTTLLEIRQERLGDWRFQTAGDVRWARFLVYLILSCPEFTFSSQDRRTPLSFTIGTGHRQKHDVSLHQRAR